MNRNTVALIMTGIAGVLIWGVVPLLWLIYGSGK